MTHHDSGIMKAVLGPRDLEELCGWEGGSLGAIGFLILQEEAAGTSRGRVGEALRISAETIESLVEQTTGLTGAEAIASWEQAVLVLKTSQVLNRNAIGSGWDAIESMAVSKLAGSLAAMGGNGDAMQMLEIATKANKAARREAGESMSNNRGSRGGRGEEPAEIDLTLRAGNLGTIRLNLSPKIRQQLQRPDRVIDGIAERISEGESGTSRLQMLNLAETRALVQTPEEAALEQQGIREGEEYDSMEKLINGLSSGDRES